MEMKISLEGNCDAGGLGFDYKPFYQKKIWPLYCWTVIVVVAFA